MFRLFRGIRIATSGVMSRIRHARKEGRLLQYGLRSIADVVRGAIWSKEELDVFPWEKFVGPDGSALGNCSGDDEVEIITGRFGDLVDLATERADAVVANELPGLRQRLKKGDRLYIGRKSARLALFAWTSTSSADDALTRKLSQTVGPDRSALVMYDSWTEPGRSDGALHRQLLSLLKVEAVSNKLDLIVRGGPDQMTFRTELERQGFLPQYRIVNYRLLHWLQWTGLFQTKPTVSDPLLMGVVGT